MKTLLLIIPVLMLFGCKSEEKADISNVFAITYQYQNQYPFNTPDSLVRIDLSSGKIMLVSSIDKFSGLKDINSKTYSKNKNLYIYTSLNEDIVLINLIDFTSEHISLTNDTAIFNVLSLLVDENDDMLYIQTISFNQQTGKNWLGIIPMDLKTKKYLPKVNFRLPPGLTGRESTAIDYQHKRIFIKPYQVDSLFVVNYGTNSMSVKKFNSVLLDLNYNGSNDNLFGTGWSGNNFALYEFSITNETIVNKGIYNGITSLIDEGFYYDRFSNAYWLETGVNGNIQMLNINLSDASTKKTISIPKRIQFIDGN